MNGGLGDLSLIHSLQVIRLLEAYKQHYLTSNKELISPISNSILLS
jgi:hypothetical protein